MPSIEKKSKPRLKSAATKKPVSVRRTITVSPDADAAVSAIAGRRGYSGYVQRAIENELIRDGIAGWLAERKAARGGRPLSASAIAFAKEAWRRGSES